MSRNPFKRYVQMLTKSSVVVTAAVSAAVMLTGWGIFFPLALFATGLQVQGSQSGIVGSTLLAAGLYILTMSWQAQAVADQLASGKMTPEEARLRYDNTKKMYQCRRYAAVILSLGVWALAAAIILRFFA